MKKISLLTRKLGIGLGVALALVMFIHKPSHASSDRRIIGEVAGVELISETPEYIKGLIAPLKYGVISGVWVPYTSTATLNRGMSIFVEDSVHRPDIVKVIKSTEPDGTEITQTITYPGTCFSSMTILNAESLLRLKGDQFKGEVKLKIVRFVRGIYQDFPAVPQTVMVTGDFGYSLSKNRAYLQFTVPPFSCRDKADTYRVFLKVPNY